MAPPATPVPASALRVDDEVELLPREVWTAEPLARVVAEDLEHLRAWEPWAQGGRRPRG